MNRLSLILLTLWVFFNIPVYAQFNIKEKIKEKTLDRVEQRIDQGIDKGLDKVEEGIIESVSNENEEDAEAEGTIGNDEKPEKASSSKSNKSKEGDATDAKKDEQPAESLKSYSKYDFISGDKVVFYDDFSQDAVGDFPALWFTDASGEVMTTNLFTGKWFMLASDGCFLPEKGINLPLNYTLEFDLLPFYEGDDQMDRIQLSIYAPREDVFYDLMGVPGNAGIEIYMGGYFGFRAYDENKDLQNDVWDKTLNANQVNRISIWVQNSRVRLYALGTKILDVPQGLTKGFQYKQIRLNTAETDNTRFLIGNIRVAEAGSDQRHKFMTDGKLISYGIHFDVNSAKIKPESYGAIKEMADIIKENPGVKVKVVGHTDSDGDEKANLDLSKRRAASVKDELTKTFGIEASRLETDGKGETEPIESNNTPLGKSKNRRVEFLKL